MSRTLVTGPISEWHHCPVSDLQERAAKLAETTWLGGPVHRFESVGRAQLEILLHEGLHPDSKVLDVGCGCLRGGYWIMRTVDPGCYFGIEPYKEMLQAGLDHIVEPEVLARARPRFDHNDRFDFGVFDTKFDFMIARSIWSHASRRQIETMLDEFCQWSTPAGIMVTSYLPTAIRYVPGSLRFTLPAWSPRLALLLPAEPGHLRDEWAGRRTKSDQSMIIRHPFRWISEECAKRQLRVTQIRHPQAEAQPWLRIERLRGSRANSRA
jgi:SAM-dependent methyltransferase